jgi:hypothetical protein
VDSGVFDEIRNRGVGKLRNDARSQRPELAADCYQFPCSPITSIARNVLDQGLGYLKSHGYQVMSADGSGEMLDPAKNVEIGSRFLGFLWKHFDEAAPLTIAGYNAGEAAVDRWLGERGDLAMDEFMETIPYDETRNYTKRVLASYFTYSWLYGKHPVPPVPLAARGKAKVPDKHDHESAKPSHSGRPRASRR